jgi:hypothetical protein
VYLCAALRVAVEKFLEGPSELLRSNAEHEADSVHEVALARPIWTDDSCELLEWADLLMALVGFEVLYFEPIDATLTSLREPVAFCIHFDRMLRQQCYIYTSGFVLKTRHGSCRCPQWRESPSYMQEGMICVSMTNRQESRTCQGHQLLCCMLNLEI